VRSDARDAERLREVVPRQREVVGQAQPAIGALGRRRGVPAVRVAERRQRRHQPLLLVDVQCDERLASVAGVARQRVAEPASDAAALCRVMVRQLARELEVLLKRGRDARQRRARGQEAAGRAAVALPRGPQLVREPAGAHRTPKPSPLLILPMSFDSPM
jgi:hypothetical protein